MDFDKFLQYLAPSVLGIISEKINMRKVNIAETIPNDVSPKSLVASAPTPAAPIVCAIVFSAKLFAQSATHHLSSNAGWSGEVSLSRLSSLTGNT